MVDQEGGPGLSPERAATFIDTQLMVVLIQLGMGEPPRTCAPTPSGRSGAF